MWPMLSFTYVLFMNVMNMLLSYLFDIGVVFTIIVLDGWRRHEVRY